MKNFRKNVMEILAQSNPRTGVSPPHWPSIQVEDLESSQFTSSSSSRSVIVCMILLHRHCWRSWCLRFNPSPTPRPLPSSTITDVTVRLFDLVTLGQAILPGQGHSYCKIYILYTVRYILYTVSCILYTVLCAPCTCLCAVTGCSDGGWIFTV